MSLGRKRPEEGICDASHRSNLALQCSKGKRIADMGAMRSERRIAKKQLPFVNQCVMQKIQHHARPSSELRPALESACGMLHCDRQASRVWIQERCRATKKEAARRRPESREETPKEGMHGKRRTTNILAPNPANARSQYRFCGTCVVLRRFCNSPANGVLGPKPILCFNQ